MKGDVNLNRYQIEKISLWQLFILMVNFQIGSAIVVGIGNDAKRDAWLAILIAMAIGVLLMRMYTFILSLAPEKNLYEIMEITFGRTISICLAVIYVEYFFYVASRVLRDFSELLVSMVFPNTPIEFVSVAMMLTISYVIFLGYEVFARTNEIFMPYLYAFLIIISIFLVFGGDIELTNLQPVLAEGIGPIARAVFPDLIGFPFGETVAFMVIMAYANKFTYITKVGITAVIAAGLILSYTAFLRISVLGVNLNERSTFPLLSVSREISIANFIERLDALVVFIMLLGIVAKVGVFFYSGLKGLEHIFQIHYRAFVYPLGTVIAAFSILIATSYVDHIIEGLKIVPLYIHMPMQIGIPAITLLILWLWRRKGEKSHDFI